MNKIVKDALILFAITLVAGVLLGFVYDITKDPIAAQNEKAKQEAYKEVMADADSFEALSGDAYSEANITATFAAALQADAENYTADEITEVVAGVKDGKVIGLVVTVVAAIWPVRRFLCLRWVQRRVFLGFCKKEEFYEKAVRQLVGCSMYDICTVASERNYGVCRKTSANWLLWC